MQQVAKALLDEKDSATPPVLSGGPGLTLTPTGEVPLDRLSQLLQFREKSLVSKVATAMRAAGPKGASEAFDSHLDTVLAIGWSNAERYCLDNFRAVVSRVDPSLRPALSLLAGLYGTWCVHKDVAFFLANGCLSARDSETLRGALHAAYGALAANNGDLALRLCDGFGIPEKLLLAPIAKDWTSIGK